MLGIGEVSDDQAIADYSKAIALKPDIAIAYIDRGLAYSKKGLDDQAIADFTKAIALQPYPADLIARAYIERGSAYSKKGLDDQAITDYTKAIALDHSPDSYNSRGRVYEKKGLYDQAIADYTEVIRFVASGYTDRARVYEKKRLYDLTIADYTKLVAADTDGKKGLNAVKQRDWNLALQSFLRVQEYPDYSDNPTILFNLGLTSEKLPGHQLRAIAWFQAYLFRAPWAPDAASVRTEVARLETSYEAGNRAILHQLDTFVPQIKKAIAQLSPSLGAEWAKIAKSYFPYAAMEVASSHYLMADEPGALRVLAAAGINIFPGGRLVVPPRSAFFNSTGHLVTSMLSNHLHADEILHTKLPVYFSDDEFAWLDYLIEFGDLDRAKTVLFGHRPNSDLWILGGERLLCAAHERADHTLFNKAANDLESFLQVALYARIHDKANAYLANLSDRVGIPDLVRLYLELGELDRAKALADFKLDVPAVNAVAQRLIDDFHKGRIQATRVCPAQLSVLIADISTWGSGASGFDGKPVPAPLWWSTGRLAFLTSVGRNGVSHSFVLGRENSDQKFDDTQNLAAVQTIGEDIAARPSSTVVDLQFLFNFEFGILNTYRMVRGRRRSN